MLRPLALVVLTLGALPQASFAGPVEQACLSSGRDAANRQTCSCIQQVADMTLGSGDQRKAATLLRDPDKAQDVFVSKRAADDAFWDRYRAFGEAAEAYCAAR